MRQLLASLMLGASLTAGCASAPSAPTLNTELVRQVSATERAFAQSMSDRDFAAFTAFLSEEAVFFSGATPLRGKVEVSASWKRFFEKPQAPFSWEPQEVVVLDSGTLALSSGPVRNPAGKQVASFTSIWRLEAPGVWRVVFVKGNDVCDCPKP